MHLQVTIDLIPLMDDEQLTSLGVTLLGQRVLLRNFCSNRKCMSQHDALVIMCVLRGGGGSLIYSMYACGFTERVWKPGAN